MTDPNADLADIRTKWLAFCSHDLDLPYPCICPNEDHRPLIAALVTEVETLRAEVARLEDEMQRQEDARVVADERYRQARTHLAALHAEAARLRSDLERTKAHGLVDELTAERDAKRPVVEAGKVRAQVRVWRHGCGYESGRPLPVNCPRCGNDEEWRLYRQTMP